MNLKEYLFYTDQNAVEFAKLCDLSPHYLRLVIKGKQKPSKKAMRLIQMASNEKIRPENICMPTNIPKELMDAN